MAYGSMYNGEGVYGVGEITRTSVEAMCDSVCLRIRSVKNVFKHMVYASPHVKTSMAWGGSGVSRAKWAMYVRIRNYHNHNCSHVQSSDVSWHIMCSAGCEFAPTPPRSSPSARVRNGVLQPRSEAHNRRAASRCIR